MINTFDCFFYIFFFQPVQIYERESKSFQNKPVNRTESERKVKEKNLNICKQMS